MTRPTAPLPRHWDPGLLDTEKIRMVMIHLLIYQEAGSRSLAYECKLEHQETAHILSNLYLANAVQCIRIANGPMWALTLVGRQALMAWYVEQCERGIHE